jgi:hypothetical protein
MRGPGSKGIKNGRKQHARHKSPYREEDGIKTGIIYNKKGSSLNGRLRNHPSDA